MELFASASSGNGQEAIRRIYGSIGDYTEF